MITTIHFLIFFAFVFINTNYILSYNIKNNLTIQQWRKIKDIMIHPSCNQNIRTKLNFILFNRYEEWACYHATLFKKKHKFLCKEIKTCDHRLPIERKAEA